MVSNLSQRENTNIPFVPNDNGNTTLFVEREISNSNKIDENSVIVIQPQLNTTNDVDETNNINSTTNESKRLQTPEMSPSLFPKTPIIPTQSLTFPTNDTQTQSDTTLALNETPKISPNSSITKTPQTTNVGNETQTQTQTRSPSHRHNCRKGRTFISTIDRHGKPLRFHRGVFDTIPASPGLVVGGKLIDTIGYVIWHGVPNGSRENFVNPNDHENFPRAVRIAEDHTWWLECALKIYTSEQTQNNDQTNNECTLHRHAPPPRAKYTDGAGSKDDNTMIVDGEYRESSSGEKQRKRKMKERKEKKERKSYYGTLPNEDLERERMLLNKYKAKRMKLTNANIGHTNGYVSLLPSLSDIRLPSLAMLSLDYNTSPQNINLNQNLTHIDTELPLSRPRNVNNENSEGNSPFCVLPTFENTNNSLNNNDNNNSYYVSPLLQPLYSGSPNTENNRNNLPTEQLQLTSDEERKLKNEEKALEITLKNANTPLADSLRALIERRTQLRNNAFKVKKVSKAKAKPRTKKNVFQLAIANMFGSVSPKANQPKQTRKQIKPIHVMTQHQIPKFNRLQALLEVAEEELSAL